MREHEEIELLYVLRGTVMVTLKQHTPHEKVLYRRLLDGGDLAYYPGWQPHSIVSVEQPQATC